MKDKIITIIPSLYDGGAEKFTADLSYSLSENYEHSLMLYNPKGHKYDHKGDLLELDIPESKNLIGRINRQLNILKKIKSIKKALQPKITISHMLMANMLNILSRKQGKTICVLHGEWSVSSGQYRLLDRIIKHYYGKADMIISVSHYIKKMFDGYYKLKVPHRVIYVGVDIKETVKKAEEILEMILPNNYIVYVAGFRPVKNHLELISHLESYLLSSDISLVLVGDGPLRKTIEAVVYEKNLSDKVLLLGNLPNPYPVVKQAKMSLVVSSSESFSLIVVESMALGVPVIATDCGGPREIIVPNWIEDIKLPYRNDFGVLIPKLKDVKRDVFVAQINNLLEDKTMWNNISEKGKIRAQEFSIQHSEKEYEMLLDEMLA